jgi:hypothetical protein
LLKDGLLIGLKDDFIDDNLIIFGCNDEELGGSFGGILIDFVVLQRSEFHGDELIIDIELFLELDNIFILVKFIEYDLATIQHNKNLSARTYGKNNLVLDRQFSRNGFFPLNMPDLVPHDLDIGFILQFAFYYDKNYQCRRMRHFTRMIAPCSW